MTWDEAQKKKRVRRPEWGEGLYIGPSDEHPVLLSVKGPEGPNNIRKIYGLVSYADMYANDWEEI